MNKIFNVIWNVVTQTWVVVSELTRTHTKCASATVAVAVLATLLSATAEANDTLTIGGNTPATGGTATPKVNVTSTANGLNFAQEGKTGKEAYVHLNGIGSTLG